MKDQKAICISASNIIKNQRQSTSFYISEIIEDVLLEKKISCEILDLRKSHLMPCIGCRQCRKDKRCGQDAEFNRIYEKIKEADYLFLVSPYCAPIPAKLSMILEKMEKMTCAQYGKTHTGRQRLPTDTLAGILSYGKGEGGEDLKQGIVATEEKLLAYKAMVNDIIAGILGRISLRTVPYNSKWNTGIVLPIGNDFQRKGGTQDQALLEKEIRQYVEVIVQTSKSLYAIY